MVDPVRVLNLYSVKDKNLGMVEDLETHLALLKRKEEIIIESEATIGGGGNLQEGMERLIDRAEIILILVSANLMASHDALVARALARRNATSGKVRTIPVLVRPFDLQGSPLSEQKPLPSDVPVSAWKDADEAWVAVVKGLRQVIAEVRKNRPLPSSVPNLSQEPSASKDNAPTSTTDPRKGLNKKLLMISANPSKDQRIAINKEFAEIKRRIESSLHRDRIQVETELEVRVTDLAGLLVKRQPHVLLFSGHGAPSGAILLVDPDHSDKSRPMPISALLGFFEALRDDLCCVVLNACYSSTDEELAQNIADVIGFAVGMSGEIKDDAALVFSSTFFEMLAMGRTIDTAFRVAKTQIAAMGVPGKDLPRLKCGPTADPSKFILVG